MAKAKAITKGKDGKKLKFPLEAYSVSVKKKVAVTTDVRVTKTERNAYMLRGQDSEGRKVAAIVSKEKAEYWIKAGVAKKDFK